MHAYIHVCVCTCVYVWVCVCMHIMSYVHACLFMCNSVLYSMVHLHLSNEIQIRYLNHPKSTHKFVLLV